MNDERNPDVEDNPAVVPDEPPDASVADNAGAVQSSDSADASDAPDDDPA